MLYLQYFGAGLLGMVFIVLASMREAKSHFKIANETFKYSKFFEDEAIGIAMSITFLLIMVISIQEWVKLRPWLQGVITLIFILGGALGSGIFMYFLGKTSSYIKKVIDIKTNIADGIAPQIEPQKD